MKNKKTKVVHAIPNMEPSNEGVFVGGSVNEMLKLVNSLRSKNGNMDQKIFTNTRQKDKRNFEKSNCEKIEAVYNPFERSTYLYGLYFVATCINHVLLKNEKYDIFHGHSGFGVYVVISYVLKLISNVKSFHTIYCPISAENGGLRGKINKISIKYFGENIDKIFAMSKNVKTSMTENGLSKEKFVAMPPSFDLEKYSPNKRSNKLRGKLEGPKSVDIILFIGNIKKEKGLDVLVKSLSNIDKEFKFVFTTELNEDVKSGVKELAYSILSRDKFRGRVTKLGVIDFMPSLIASSDLVVLPFRTTRGPSDYPVVLLEAMASGVASIASAVGGIPELIDDGRTGLLVEPENASELADAIRLLLEDKDLRKEIASAARNKAISLSRKSSPPDIVYPFYSK